MVAPFPFFAPRGSPFHVYYRAMALGRAGYEIDLVTYSLGENVNLPGVRHVRSWPVPFIRRIKIGPSLAKLPLDMLLFLRALSLLLTRHYDAVNTHEEAGFFGAVASRLFGMPHIHDMHSDLVEQVQNAKFTRNRILLGMLARVQRMMLRSARVIIAICPELVDAARSYAPASQVVLIENAPVGAEGSNATPESTAEGMDARVSELRREFDLPPSAGPVLLYTGTFETYQGLDLLLASIPDVLAEFPEARYALVGGSPSQVARLQAQAETLDIAASVRIVGQRPPNEMPAWMSLAGILLSPRSQGTNTPLKIYSYLNAGKPLLATRIRSHTQVLTDDVALLVPPTRDGLVDGTKALLGDADLRARLGERAHALATERYTLDAFCEHTVAAYALALPSPVAPASSVSAVPTTRVLEASHSSASNR